MRINSRNTTGSENIFSKIHNKKNFKNNVTFIILILRNEFIPRHLWFDIASHSFEKLLAFLSPMTQTNFFADICRFWQKTTEQLEASGSILALRRLFVDPVENRLINLCFENESEENTISNGQDILEALYIFSSSEFFVRFPKTLSIKTIILFIPFTSQGLIVLFRIMIPVAVMKLDFTS